MTDTNQNPVNRPIGTTDPEGSDEWGFDAERDPQNRDEEQAEASQYGIYGYQDQAGESYIKGEPSDPTSPPPDPNNTPRAEEDPTIKRAQGGQGLMESEHGAGIAQPMAGPQREAHNAPTTDDGRRTTDGS